MALVRHTPRILWLPFVLVLVLGAALPVRAQSSEAPQASPAPPALSAEAMADLQAAPVVVDGITLFQVAGVTAYPADRRARQIAERIRAAAADPSVDESALTLAQGDVGLEIRAKNQLLLVLVEPDVALGGLSRSILAETYRLRIWDAIQAYRTDRNPQRLLRRGLLTGAGALVLALVLWLAHWIVRRLRRSLQRRYEGRLQAVEAKSVSLVRAEQIWLLLRALLNLAWAAGAILATYAYLNFSLMLFPWTRGLGSQLTAIVIDPLRTMAAGVLNEIPDLAFLVVLTLVTRYLLKTIHLAFEAIRQGRMVLEKFDPEWAMPTYRLVRVGVIAFALVVAFPYIPGSQTDAFKGVSLFIGIVFSLGSSSVIGNTIAGYSMTYRRAFRVGDRIKVGEYVGDVEQIRLMVTHLRTPKNEEVVVPNSTILSTEVVNYSALAKREGLILHTTVGIGYETPWRQVEAMLIEAAARTRGLLREPKPFVLQQSLGDFCVVYEINVYCDNPRAMNHLYTALHQHILDVFNEYGVQIMTPAYEGDPAEPKIVPKSDWYLKPAPAPERAGE